MSAESEALANETKFAHPELGQPAHVFPYHDEDGKVAFWNVRFEPKTFRQCRPDSSNEDRVTWGLGGLERTLYRAADLRRSVETYSNLICYAEGEGDVDLVRMFGFPAVTAGSATAWESRFAESFRGLNVIIFRDADEPGRQLAEKIAQDLQGVAVATTVIGFKDGPKDVSDWIIEQYEDGLSYEQIGENLRTAMRAAVFFRHTQFGQAVISRLWLGPSPATYLETAPRYLERVLTDFPTLNQKTRGGIPAGIVTTFLGPPGSGKTALLSQLGIRASSDGYLVVILFKDEGRTAGSIRLGQQFGLDRDRLESQDPEELRLFHEALAARDIHLHDPDAPDFYLDEFVPRALEAARLTGKRLFLAVDSVQSIRLRAEYRTVRETIEAKYRVVEDAAKAGAMVIVTSEANRSFYRNKDDDQNIEAIAAGAESRAIEYVSRLIISLKGDAYEGVVRMQVVKNSPGAGAKPTIPLTFDRKTARFTEISGEDAEAIADEGRIAKDRAEEAKVRAKILKALPIGRELPFGELRAAVGGDRGRFLATLKAMVAPQEEGGLGRLLVSRRGKSKVYSRADAVRGAEE